MKGLDFVTSVPLPANQWPFRATYVVALGSVAFEVVATRLEVVMQRVKAFISLLVACGLVVLWVANAAEKRATQHGVYFVNAMPFAVEVDVDGHSFTLPTGGLVQRELAMGGHHVRVVRADDKRPIEVQHFEMPRFTECAVYNVAGAAPLIDSEITYGSRSKHSSDATDERFTVRAYDRFATFNVRFCFEPPAEQISTSGTAALLQPTRIERQLALQEDLKWSDTINALAETGRKTEAVEIARRVALASIRDQNVLSLVRDSLQASGLAEHTAEIFGAVLEARDQHVLNHVAYQNAMIANGRRAEVLATYQRRMRREDCDSQYLLWRVTREADRETVLQQAIDTCHDAPLIELALLSTLADQHAAPNATLAKALRRADFDKGHAARVEQLIAGMLVERGRTKQALRERTNRMDVYDVLRLQLLARIDVGEEFQRVPEVLRVFVVDVMLDSDPVEVPPEDDTPLTKLAVAMRAGKEQAARAAMNRRTWINVVPSGVTVMYPLASAVWHAGDHETAKQMLDYLTPMISRRAVERILFHGEADPELADAHLEERGALMFALALQTTDKARQRKLVKQALRDEPLPGPLHVLAKSWL